MAVAAKQMEMSQQQQNVQEQHVQQSQEQQQQQSQAAQNQMQQQQMQVQSSQASQQQQQNQNNAQHNVQQVQLQGAVAVSMQHQQQQQGVGSVSMALAGQQGATTITTMAAHPQAVQVIQQPMQSQAYHLQQLYNTQGTPLLMPGNLALHPAGINPSSIQVIAAGKPFQSAGQLTPHMLTTASNPGQGGGHGGPGGKVQGFPAGYLPVPTSGNPGGGQTLVFGQLGVLGSPQPPQGMQQQQQQQQNNNKSDQVQKYTTCAAGTQSGGRGGAMQFAPWQFTPQVAWTAGLQPPGTTLLAAPNQIFIRSPTQPDMYIQSPQPLQAHNALATQQQIQGVQQIAAANKPRVMDIQQQPQQQSKQGGTGQRPLSILPSSLQGVQGANIRPASSVSTQTVHGVQTTSGKGSGSGGKGRGKPVVRTSPGTNTSQLATKADAANQTKSNVHHATMIMQQQTNATNNNGNNKVLITTNQPVVTSAQPPGSPMTTADKQNFGQQNKTVMQSQQQHQGQQQQVGQHQMQPQYQQMFMQQMQQLQHQQLQYQQAQQQNSQQQQIQPKPIMSMAIPPQQQPGVVLGTERPIMPVVSMGGVGVGVATTLQMNQVQQSQMSSVQQLPISTLNQTIIGNQVVSGGSQVQSMPMMPQSNEPPQQPPPQQQEVTGTTPLVITSSDRSQQNDCQVMVQQCNTSNSTAAEEESKSAPKKEENEGKDVNGASAVTQESEASRNTAKEDTSSSKSDDKLNNPLANLANAVNSITNGITEDPPATSATTTTAVSVNSKQAPPKALVKPQVLTHVIEGFVIQEASEPFSVNRSTLNGTVTQETTNSLNKNNLSDRESHDEPPSKKRKKHASNYSNDGDSNGGGGKCEACGNILDEHNIKFKKDKRFCSSVCAKSKKREAREREADKQWTDMEVDKKSDDSMKKSVDERSTAASTPTNEDIPRINPVKWTVNEVCDFIRNLPGCADYAEDFAIQEIDGQALMLLKEDHLMSAMSIKLGPALKIVAKIDSMRIDNNVNSSPMSNSS